MFFLFFSLAAGALIGSFTLDGNLNDASSLSNPFTAAVMPVTYSVDKGVVIDSTQLLSNSPDAAYEDLTELEVRFRMYPTEQGEHHPFCAGRELLSDCDFAIVVTVAANPVLSTIDAYQGATLLCRLTRTMSPNTHYYVTSTINTHLGKVRISVEGIENTCFGAPAYATTTGAYLAVGDPGSDTFEIADLLVYNEALAFVEPGGPSSFWIVWAVPLIILALVGLAIYYCARKE